MLRHIAPVFFTMDIPATLACYTGKLGFACLGTWKDPPVYTIVARDQQVIHFRCARPPTANPDKYADELLDAYLVVEDADALYAQYAAQGVEFTRGLGNMPWHCPRVRGEGLRWPSAGFRREPVAFTRHSALLSLFSPLVTHHCFRFPATRQCSSQSMLGHAAERLPPAML
jgi:hypothetical protein